MENFHCIGGCAYCVDPRLTITCNGDGCQKGICADCSYYCRECNNLFCHECQPHENGVCRGCLNHAYAIIAEELERSS